MDWTVDQVLFVMLVFSVPIIAMLYIVGNWIEGLIRGKEWRYKKAYGEHVVRMHKEAEVENNKRNAALVKEAKRIKRLAASYKETGYQSRWWLLLIPVGVVAVIGFIVLCFAFPPLGIAVLAYWLISSAVETGVRNGRSG